MLLTGGLPAYTRDLVRNLCSLVQTRFSSEQGQTVHAKQWTSKARETDKKPKKNKLNSQSNKNMY